MQYHQITSRTIRHRRPAATGAARRGAIARTSASALDDQPQVARNRRTDGGCRAFTACERTSARRTRSRRNDAHHARDLGARGTLPAPRLEPRAGLRLPQGLGHPAISHETIYLHVWADKRAGGGLWTHLQAGGQEAPQTLRRLRLRGRLAGKRHISERPPEVEERRELGHWEIDTVMGDEHGRNSVVTLVERATGYLVMGKLARHCAAEATARCIELIDRHAGPRAHRHRRQRHRVPRLRADRGGHRRGVLLRDPAPLLGARHEREHERTRSASTCPSARAWRT